MENPLVDQCTDSNDALRQALKGEFSIYFQY